MSMSLLEQILKLPKKNSPVVISILLGIIIIGAMWGGLWINSLQNTLAERDALANATLSLIEERYKTNFNSLALRVDKAEIQLAEFHKLFGKIEPQLTSVSQRLTEMSSDSQMPSNHRATLKQLSDEISETSSDVQ